ncbi:hypothetical protein AAV98_05655 [Bacillus sp. CHD6a]|nr:hypothetical protein AAV98_05655 [Bacillus sp. CHD6a]
MVFSVDVLGVFGVDFLHDETDVGGFRFDEQVGVVGHEAVGVQFKWIFVFDFEEDALVGMVVFWFKEDDAAAVSSCGDVVHGSWEPDSWVSGHSGWCSFRGWDLDLVVCVGICWDGAKWIVWGSCCGVKAWSGPTYIVFDMKWKTPLGV